MHRSTVFDVLQLTVHLIPTTKLQRGYQEVTQVPGETEVWNSHRDGGSWVCRDALGSLRLRVSSSSTSSQTDLQE